MEKTIKNKELISIITPIHVKDINNLGNFIEQLNLFNNTIKDLEIILVLNGGNSDSFEPFKNNLMSNDFSNLKILEFNLELIIGLARNLGAIHASGEYLIFMDCDVEVSEMSILALLKSLNSLNTDKYAAIMPGIQKYCGSTIWTELDSLEDKRSYECRINENNSLILYGPFNIIKTTIFKRLGGWEYRIVCSEDRDMALRILNIGKKIKYIPEIVICHKNPTSFKNVLKRKIFHAKVNALVYERYPLYYKKSTKDWVNMVKPKLNIKYNIFGLLYAVSIFTYFIVFYYSRFVLKRNYYHLIKIEPFYLI